MKGKFQASVGPVKDEDGSTVTMLKRMLKASITSLNLLKGLLRDYTYV